MKKANCKNNNAMPKEIRDIYQSTNGLNQKKVTINTKALIGIISLLGILSIIFGVFIWKNVNHDELSRMIGKDNNLLLENSENTQENNMTYDEKIKNSELGTIQDISSNNSIGAVDNELHTVTDWGISINDVRLYGGCESNDGGLIVGGTFDSSNLNLGNGITLSSNGNTDGIIIKYNADKQIEWAKSYGGEKADWIYSIDKTSDGGYIATGDFTSKEIDIEGKKFYNNTGNNDGIVIKYNANGDVQWVSTIGGELAETIDEVIETSDQGILISLISSSSSLDIDGATQTGIQKGAMLIKYNAKGELQWCKQIVIGSLINDIYSLVENSSKEYLITVQISSSITYTLPNGEMISSKGDYDGLVIKCNELGEITFYKTIGGTGEDAITTAIQTSDGNIYIGGYFSNSITLENGTTLQANGNTQGFIIKYNQSGEIEWSKSIGGSGAESVQALMQRSDGKIIVGADSTAGFALEDGFSIGNNGSKDFVFLQYDRNGKLEATKLVGGNDYDNIYKMKETSDGAILVIGYYYSDTIDLGNGEILTNISGSDGIALKISQYIEEKLNIKETKQWNDNNDKAKKRPNGIQIILKNGTEEVSRQQVNEQNGWTCTFNDIPKKDESDNEINYTVEEEEINTNDLNCYSTGNITGNAVDGFTITNTIKTAKVIVHYYIEGTTDRVPVQSGGTAQDISISGVIGDSYSTTELQDISNKYELVST